MPRKSRFTPQQQRMYRRRRIIAFFAAIVVLALVVFVVISDVRFAGAVGHAVYGKLHADEANAISRSNVPAPDPTLAKAHTAGIPDCTSDDVTLTLDEASKDSETGNSASSSASASDGASNGSSSDSSSVSSGASSSSSASSDADSDDTTTDNSTAEYLGTASFGSGITFTAVLNHKSKQNCLVNAASDSESLVVTSVWTGDVVYDSSVCDTDPVYLLMRDSDEDRRAISWGAYAQTTECVTNPTSSDAVPAGRYVVQLKLAGVDGVQSAQGEVYVTAAASGSDSASDSASGDASDSSSGSSSSDSGSASDASSAVTSSSSSSTSDDSTSAATE
ncbi:hypothetical protein [Pseudoscardovia suis]|nr:hypothetical protein [Pseudoscardovia suis]